MKHMTLGEAETKRLQAVEFLRRIGNDDAASQFDDMDAREYAEHRGVAIVESNPKRRTATMATYTAPKTKADLQDELEEARDYIEQLEGRLDSIVGVANGDDEDDEDEEDDEDDEDE